MHGKRCNCFVWCNDCLGIVNSSLCSESCALQKLAREDCHAATTNTTKHHQSNTLQGPVLTLFAWLQQLSVYSSKASLGLCSFAIYFQVMGGNWGSSSMAGATSLSLCWSSALLWTFPSLFRELNLCDIVSLKHSHYAHRFARGYMSSILLGHWCIGRSRHLEWLDQQLSRFEKKKDAESWGSTSSYLLVQVLDHL